MAALFASLLPAIAACGGGGGSDSAATPPSDPPPSPLSVVVNRAFPALTFAQPLAMVQPPGDSGRWFLAEQGGRVLVFPNQPAAAAATVAVDLTDRVVSGGEAGLLGIAFHPRFADNGEVFLSYTAAGNPLVSRISRFLSPDRTTIDPASEQILLTLDQPFANHNGGHILFGPDGFLYAGFGDGGSAGDPLGNAQNTGNLFGAILRLNVDAAAPGLPYAIPPDNPFAAGGGRAEIFAWGLRNPWRFNFDRATGTLWAGDVGQNAWEEVDVIVRGGNFGWDVREGAHCFEPAAGCPTAGLIDPVAEYPHAAGSADCSVTGGYVYRGAASPALQGTYLFGDFCSGIIRGLPLGADGLPTAAPSVLAASGLNISSFAERNDGELFVLDLVGGGIYQLASQ
jgi:glucose/arabinose dehydrogenase